MYNIIEICGNHCNSKSKCMVLSRKHFSEQNGIIIAHKNEIHELCSCFSKESVIQICFHRCLEQSICSSVSARDHHGGPTWSCFLVAECCAHPRTQFSLQVHINQYGDCSSSHREIENLACWKVGVESVTVSVVT